MGKVELKGLVQLQNISELLILLYIFQGIPIYLSLVFYGLVQGACPVMLLFLFK